MVLECVYCPTVDYIIGNAFQVVVMLMGKKCCATDVLNRVTIIFFIISGPIIEVIVKEANLTNIVEFVQLFSHLNKLPSKPPLHEANEFQILEPLSVAMVSDFVNYFCSFSLYSFYFVNVST